MSVSLIKTPPSPTHNAPLSKYSLTSFGLIPPVGIRGTPGNIEDNVFIKSPNNINKIIPYLKFNSNIII